PGWEHTALPPHLRLPGPARGLRGGVGSGQPRGPARPSPRPPLPPAPPQRRTRHGEALALPGALEPGERAEAAGRGRRPGAAQPGGQ
ncbi:unnamed protein product, partial [Coccothraustes coccothraustes]